MTCICASARRTVRLLSRYYEDRLRPAGVTPAQFELLSELASNPDRPQAALAEDLGLDQTTLSRNLKAMIGCEWVASSAPRKDRRQALYLLTAKGREALRLATPYWQEAHLHVKKHLGDDWQSASSMLDKLASAVSA
jgi:DNA-binding MarR family transcriptional regulator